jgi:hypothetical protein
MGRRPSPDTPTDTVAPSLNCPGAAERVKATLRRCAALTRPARSPDGQLWERRWTSDGPLDVGDRAYQRERQGLGNETDLNPARSAVRGRDPVHVEPGQPSRSRTTRTTGAASSYLTASFEDITRARIAITNYHDFKRREWIELSAGGCSVHGMTGGALTSPAYGVGVLPARQNGTERSYRSTSKRSAIYSHAPICNWVSARPSRHARRSAARSVADE